MTVVSSVYFKPYVEYRTFLVWSVTYTAKCSRQKSTSCTVLIVECKMKCAMWTLTHDDLWPQVPPHLATSPLPDAALLMEEGIMQLHEGIFNIKEEEGSTCDTITTPEGLWEPHQCGGDADSDTSKEVAALTPDDNGPSSIVMPRDTSMRSLYYSTDDITSSESTRKRSLDIAIQTDLTGNEVESKTNYCVRVISPLPGDFGEIKTGENNETPVTQSPSGETNAKQLSEELAARLLADCQHPTIQPARKKCKLHTALTSGDRERNKDSSSDGSGNKGSHDSDVLKTGGAKNKRRRRKKPNNKQMKQTVGSAKSNETTSNDVVPMLTMEDDGEVFQLELSDDEITTEPLDECDCRGYDAVGSTTTLTELQCQDAQPTMEEKLRLTDEWAGSQLASGLHPFSDGDITPVMR